MVVGTEHLIMDMGGGILSFRPWDGSEEHKEFCLLSVVEPAASAYSSSSPSTTGAQKVQGDEPANSL